MKQTAWLVQRVALAHRSVRSAPGEEVVFRRDDHEMRAVRGANACGDGEGAGGALGGAVWNLGIALVVLVRV